MLYGVKSCNIGSIIYIWYSRVLYSCNNKIKNNKYLQKDVIYHRWKQILGMKLDICVGGMKYIWKVEKEKSGLVFINGGKKKIEEL